MTTTAQDVIKKIYGITRHNNEKRNGGTRRGN